MKNLLSIGILMLSGMVTFGQSNIVEKRVSLHLKDASFYIVAGTLIESYDVPIGLEVLPNTVLVDDVLFEYNRNFRFPNGGGMSWPLSSDLWPPAEKIKFTLDFDKVTLSEAMDTIVAKMPGYRWESDGHVINILPKADRDPRIIKLLDLKIREFEIEANEPIATIMYKLISTPEFKSFETEQHVEFPKSVEGASSNDARRLPAKLSFEKLTVKELLNAILREKRGGWIVRLDRWPEKDKDGRRRGMVVNL